MEVVGIHGSTDKSDLKHLVIPEGIKSIKDNVFSRHGEIVSVSFPESLEKIGALSFSMCHALQKVSIPKNVKVIKHSAFFPVFLFAIFFLPFFVCFFVHG